MKKKKVRKFRCYFCKDLIEGSVCFIMGHNSCSPCYFRVKSENHNKHYYDKKKARIESKELWENAIYESQN